MKEIHRVGKSDDHSGRMTQARYDRFVEMIVAAASASDADERLAAMLADPATHPLQSLVAVTLGEVSPGPAGRAALRASYASATQNHAAASKSIKSEYTDLICATVTALAKRDGPAASDILAEAAGSPIPVVRDYGISALAAVGDDRAWEPVMTRLTANLRRRINSPHGVTWHQTCSAIEYLARHAPPGSDRAVRLITLLRSRWHNLADPELINRWWPAIRPEREPALTIDLSGHRPRAWLV